MQKEYINITVHNTSCVQWIGLNCPETRNALSAPLLCELVDACQDANDDNSIGCIVIYSCHPPVFSSGADLKERQGMTPIQVRRRRRYARDCYDQLERIDKPLIAAIQGKVVGGGNEITGCCDITLASEKASFRYVEVVVGSVGATQRITRAIGSHRAKELLFTGREIDSQEAYNIGLVTRRLPDENFLEQVQQTAAIIASRNPISLSMSKKAVNMASQAAPEHGILVEQLGIELNLASGDPKKGLADFNAGKTSKGESI